LLLPTDAGGQWWTVYLAFGVLIVFEGLVPYWVERTGMTMWHPHHIAERYGHYFIFAGLGGLGAGLQVVVTFVGGHSTVAPTVAAWAFAIPIALYLVSLVVAHLRILPGILIHVWSAVTTTVVVLLLPLLTDSLGLPVVFALTAIVVAAAVAATLALGRSKFGPAQ
jgi:hypothetical protein